MNRKVLVTSLMLSLGTASFANSTNDEIALLKEQLKMLSQKIEQLETKAENNEAQVKEVQKAAEVKTAKSGNWADRIKLSGDMRYRAEYIDEREREVRNRHRLRLRLKATTEINDRLNVGFRLVSGGDNPTSANQTLDGAFTTKDFLLDQAFFDYKLTDQLNLLGGKFSHPIYKPGKTQILWDNDAIPEGMALKFAHDGWKGNLFGYAVEENSSADDVLLFGGQLNKTFALSDSNALIAGVSYYDYQDLQGSAPLFDGNARGNTLDSNGLIANDFNIFEASLEYKTKFINQPLSVFGTYVENTEADDLNSGYAVGFDLGKVTDPGTWHLNYSYMDIDADAVYALFNDSNFGNGNTDTKGHVLRGGYGLFKNTSLIFAYFSNEARKDQPNNVDYDRFQLDFMLKFK